MTTYPPAPIRVLHSVPAAAGRGALLLPRGLVALAATLAGRPATAAGVLRPGAVETARTGVGHRIWASLVAVVLGVLALIPVGAEVLCVARGLCYGLVDRGPYDHSWGGPTLAGAWAAHFAISLPFVAVGLLVLAGLDGLHRGFTAPLAGRRTPAWAPPVALVACAAGAVLFTAWLRQI
ncbi:hypothetical protein [Actinocatenispora sera]|uniref:Uncharacterized protein n=1 Tax=Actinocatenispora sera TaxID=390989 RepID=A0A810KZ28_9ACTN|nr:hypothetical protein [Actinocatenispora sera]BCJ28374.1 hypothetical protein Asera_24820 [Actinocatenispora sera]